MQVKTYEAEDERATLAAMCTDDQLLAHVAARWGGGGLFGSQYANLLAGWCVKHYVAYKAAPGAAVEGYFTAWAATADAKLAGAVSTFISYLSSTHTPVATAYALDRAEGLFARVAVTGLVAGIEAAMLAGQPQRAVQLVEGWRKPVLKQTQGIDLLADQAALQAAFEDALDPVVQYPGALGQFYQGQLARDSFIAFLAPEKRGKTFMLMDVAWTAATQARRVAYFSVGDMSQNQCIRRFSSRIAKAPVKARTVKIPQALTVEKQDSIWLPTVSMLERKYGQPLDWQTAWGAFEKYNGQGRKQRLRLHTSPAGTTTVADIRGVVQGWEWEGWVPDVVCIDYADILAPPLGYQAGERAAHNAVWEQLRALSQELHACVVTATQADAPGGIAYVLNRLNFSEDKRKLAHCTGMVGLNQTLQEKALDVMRLNWVALREEEFIETSCVWVAGCRPLAAPCIRSAWAPQEKPKATD